jgi:hypothetical protein
MRRGFKAWCERASSEYRQALGLSLAAALDPLILAEHLNVRVLMPEDVPSVLPQSLLRLRGSDGRATWSAVTITQGGIRLVILNSGHPSTRRANSLAHELAHIILNHTSDDTQWSPEGVLFRNSFDEEQEDEANWLAGCLLLPRQGLLQVYRRQPGPRELARHFGVSQRLVNWRLRMTGIMRQAKRAAALGAGWNR